MQYWFCRQPDVSAVTVWAACWASYFDTQGQRDLTRAPWQLVPRPGFLHSSHSHPVSDDSDTDIKSDKKLRYRRGTARRALSASITCTMFTHYYHCIVPYRWASVKCVFTAAVYGVLPPSTVVTCALRRHCKRATAVDGCNAPSTTRYGGRRP